MITLTVDSPGAGIWHSNEDSSSGTTSSFKVPGFEPWLCSHIQLPDNTNWKRADDGLDELESTMWEKWVEFPCPRSA